MLLFVVDVMSVLNSFFYARSVNIAVHFKDLSYNNLNTKRNNEQRFLTISIMIKNQIIQKKSSHEKVNKRKITRHFFIITSESPE